MDKKKGLRKRSGQQGESSRKSRKVKNSFSSKSFAYSAHMTNMLYRVERENTLLRNFVLSPLSIDVVLHMLAAGLQGDALEQMLNFLGYKNMGEILSQGRAMMKVLEGLIKHKGVNDLCMLNGVWIDEDYYPSGDEASSLPDEDSSLPSEKDCSLPRDEDCSLPNEHEPIDMDMDKAKVSNYIKKVLRRIFNCRVTSRADFLKETDGVVNAINSWVEEASNGLIKKLVPDGVLNQETGLVFANALYFKGTWDSEHKFKKKWTKERDFHLLDGETVRTSFMTSAKKYHCKSFSDFKVLKIPYKKGELGKFSMFFFLPNGRFGLPVLLEKLSNSHSQQEDYFDLEEVILEKLWIPKFDIQYDFDVPAIMKKKAIVFPSMENSEDFSEMVPIRQGALDFATNLFQKVVIKIDEEGTEVATATSFSFPRARKYTQLSFVADHPFMFMIKEENSGLIFFMGSVLNPSL